MCFDIPAMVMVFLFGVFIGALIVRAESMPNN
jgi:hypothetical protein